MYEQLLVGMGRLRVYHGRLCQRRVPVFKLRVLHRLYRSGMHSSGTNLPLRPFM